ncbi:hypothetical protein ACIP6V_09115 [Streptomyces sp. NPDC088770]|uniref:hypothetical protein n=1 Tax=Streptomyces sp. NPDC088770 TaxID=3365895 RepID=UPI0038061001
MRATPPTRSRRTVGYGANTGIADTFNLAWKPALRSGTATEEQQAATDDAMTVIMGQAYPAGR